MSAAEKKPLALKTRNSRVVRSDVSSGHGNDTCYFLFSLFVGFIVAACVCEFGTDEAVQEVFGVYAKALA